MSEADAVKGAPAVTDAAANAAVSDTASQELGPKFLGSLEEDATALLQELEDSQLEVQRMLAEQRAQAEELGGMKDHLSSELLQLKDDAWKLHLFAELEMLKRQLAAINNLDADLDAMEARLDEQEGETEDDSFQEALAAARAGTRDLLSRLGGPSGAAADSAAGASTSAGASPGAAAGALVEEEKKADEGEAENVEALQDELDAELAAMMQQLQAIKAESAMVAARKAQLELELMQLMRDEADDLTSELRDMGIGGEEEEGGQAAALGGEVADAALDDEVSEVEAVEAEDPKAAAAAPP